MWEYDFEPKLWIWKKEIMYLIRQSGVLMIHNKWKIYGWKKIGEGDLIIENKIYEREEEREAELYKKKENKPSGPSSLYFSRFSSLSLSLSLLLPVFFSYISLLLL